MTAKVLAEFRSRALPVFFTTVAYEPHLRDGGIFVEKVPALAILTKGARWVEVDERIRPRPAERVIVKKYASAFFDTRLDLELRGLGVDTVIMAGCTTSGCIRASAVDSMQYGFRTLVIRDAVGDRARQPHEVNLFDIDAKYGDVVPSGEVLRYLGSSARAAASARARTTPFGLVEPHGVFLIPVAKNAKRRAGGAVAVVDVDDHEPGRAARERSAQRRLAACGHPVADRSGHGDHRARNLAPMTLGSDASMPATAITTRIARNSSIRSSRRHSPATPTSKISSAVSP